MDSTGDSFLIPFGPDLWYADGPVLSFYGFPYPTRMVIARLAGGGLWVWSPIRLTPALRAEVEALAPVAFLIAPNHLHHLYIGEWRRAWPEAALHGEPSLIAKRRDLTFDAPLGDGPAPEWAGEIDQVHFAGSLLLNEVVFFHRRSATVIIADLSENFSEAFLARHWAPWQRAVARLWGITEPAGRAPLEVRLSYLPARGKARRAAVRLLSWPAERVIMAHGRPVTDGARTFLRRSFAWAAP